jgi:sec-independent protein translocase protein TatA
MGGLGATELIILLVIVLVFFGPSKLPGLGKSIGEAIRGFKKGMSDTDEKPAQVVREEDHRRLDQDTVQNSKVSEKKKENQS